jgi:hypothetical protein
MSVDTFYPQLRYACTELFTLNAYSIVYCKDSGRKGNHENVSFDFLGYTFQPRKTQNRKTKIIFTGYLPAIRNKSKKHIHETIRGYPLKTMKKITELSIQYGSISTQLDKLLR